MVHNHDPLDPAVNNAYNPMTPWRVGRKNGRILYALSALDAQPSDDDVMIGSMDTPVLAAAAVTAHNEAIKSPPSPARAHCRT